MEDGSDNLVMTGYATDGIEDDRLSGSVFFTSIPIALGTILKWLALAIAHRFVPMIN